MVLVGGYARQLWVLWIVKAEVTVEAEAAPLLKQSTQHYFLKNSHSPSSNRQEEDDRRRG